MTFSDDLHYAIYFLLFFGLDLFVADYAWQVVSMFSTTLGVVFLEGHSSLQGRNGHHGIGLVSTMFSGGKVI
jgi:hypothetical protein